MGKEDRNKLCVAARADKHVAEFGPNWRYFFIDGFGIGILVSDGGKPDFFQNPGSGSNPGFPVPK